MFSVFEPTDHLLASPTVERLRGGLDDTAYHSSSSRPQSQELSSEEKQLLLPVPPQANLSYYPTVFMQQGEQGEQPYLPPFHPSNFMSSSFAKKRFGNDMQVRKPTLSAAPRVLSSYAAPGQSLYEATYSNTTVYEFLIADTAVMRRKETGWINATHILKVAGVEKGKRTKILEKEVQGEPHQKIQGGFGKYQGTWVPLERARQLCVQFGVGDVLAPILDIPL